VRFVYIDTDKSKIAFGMCRYLELVLVSSSDEIASDVSFITLCEIFVFLPNYVAHAASARK
jgi:hypothetical protein